MSPQGRERVSAMATRDFRTVSGIGQSYHNNNQGGVSVITHRLIKYSSKIKSDTKMTKNTCLFLFFFFSLSLLLPKASLPRRNGAMALNQRSHSAAPSENYRTASVQRRNSLSPPEDMYQDYSALPMHQQYSNRFQSRSATATPTGSPKKRQLPQIPQGTNRANIRDRLAQDFEERGVGRFSRYRTRQTHHPHQQTYRSTGLGGWERHYTGLSDSDLTMHSMESRLRSRHSISPDKDFMGDFGDSDMESVVSVTSSAFSTQSERPRGSRGLR